MSRYFRKGSCEDFRIYGSEDGKGVLNKYEG